MSPAVSQQDVEGAAAAAAEVIARRGAGEMAKSFDHAAVEAGWDAYWQGAIAARRQQQASSQPSTPPFSVVFPPPNITGVLHIGHALTVAVQDALVRWRRMAGDDVLFVPGLDHAGIATQSVVERQLAAAGAPGRRELGREAFVARVGEWAAACGGRIRGQLRRLGGAFDWPAEAYTLDAPRSAAVTAAFVELHRRGLLKRQARLVNWCPALRTAISDIEVDVRQVTRPEVLRLPGGGSVEVGVLTTFAYPLEGAPAGADGAAEGAHGSTHVWVGTTRLETMLGDVAVAVHPDDARLAHLIGRSVRHPLTGRTLPIIGDATLVDPAVGTGAVKVTPAHDANDYACAQRHGLAVVPLLDDGGCLIAGGPPEVPARFGGMPRFTARTQVAAELRAAGLFVTTAPHAMALALCSRSGDILEPMLKPQWFVDCTAAAAASATAVRDGSLPILPAAYRREWYAWLDNIQPWCVSRQLWWGHRIPAWRIEVPGGGSSGGGEEWVVAADEAAAAAEAAARYPGVPAHELRLVRDPDVLDTWFSSALFPMSALGWPTAPLPRHYPLSVMETGADILFFWVARMSMLCTALAPPPSGRQPFAQVMLHPVVRDRTGRKMSKSLGNVIDPLHVMDGVSLDTLLAELATGNLPPGEVKKAGAQLTKDYPTGIAACGADALRLALALYMRGHGGRAAGAMSASIHLDVTRIHAARLFCNKLWNAARFVLGAVGDARPLPRLGVHADGSRRALRLPDAWLLHRCDAAADAVSEALAERDIGAAAAAAHDFVLRDLCDTYIEWVKFRLAAGGAEGETAGVMLATALATGLRLLHPFMPFVTEELHHRLTAWGLQGSGVAAAGSGLLPTTPLLHAGFPQGAGAAAGAAGVPCDAASRTAALADMSLAISVLHAARSVRKVAGDILGAGVVSSLQLAVVLPPGSSGGSSEAAVLEGERAALAAQLRLPTPAALALVVDGDDAAAAAGAGAVLTAVAERGVAVRIHMPASTGTLAGIDKEAGRLGKRVGKARADHDALTARMAAPEYAKVPAGVQAGDAATAQAAAAELAALEATVSQLAALRLRVEAALAK